MEETIEQLNRRYADALLPVTILFGVFMVCGVAGNVLVLIVFALGRVYRGNNFRVFVIFLAVIDLICCVLILPSEIAKHRNYFNFTSVGLCRARVFINMWGAVSCSLALLVVSVDRYRRVCCPLKRQISQSLALQLCAVITFGISVIVALPGIVIHDIVTNDKTNKNGTKTVVYVCSIALRFRGHPLEMIFQVLSGLVLAGVTVSTIALYIPICRQIYLLLYSSPAFDTGLTGRESKQDNHVPNQNATQKSEQQNVSETAAPETDIPFFEHANGLDRGEIQLSQHQQINPVIEEAATAARDRRPPRTRTLDRLMTMTSFMSSFRRKHSVQRARSRYRSQHVIKKFPYKTLIWLILTFVFITTNILSMLLSILNPNIIHKDSQQYVVFTVFNRLFYINNCINPFVYALLSRNFRKAIKGIGPRMMAY